MPTSRPNAANHQACESQANKEKCNMKQRSGLTLVEVLVAIFIMGVGMLAILTLFPLGLMTAGQALQDDRVVQLVGNAAAIANARNVRNDPNVLAAFNN